MVFSGASIVSRIVGNPVDHADIYFIFFPRPFNLVEIPPDRLLYPGDNFG